MWGGRTRHKDSGGNAVSGGNGIGGRQVWLHELVEAITTALIDATRPIQGQHIAAVEETFTATETKSQANGRLRDVIPESVGRSKEGTSSHPGEQTVFRPDMLLMELPVNGGATGDQGMTAHAQASGSLRALDVGGHQSASNQQLGTTVAVPRAALLQSNALVIDEATIELECVFDRFATEAPLPNPPPLARDGSVGVNPPPLAKEGSVEDTRRSCAPRLGVWLDRTGNGSPARIVIKFKRVDRPEGASRIDDALLRNIQ